MSLFVEMSPERRAAHEALLEGTGICQQSGHRPTAETPSLWDSRQRLESLEDAQYRHREARILCRKCPLLTACEQALSDYEKHSEEVDGVMAARYCDIGYSTGLKERQTHCSACRRRLHRQGSKRRLRSDHRRHVGEGLCSECYPQFSTHAHTERKDAA